MKRVCKLLVVTNVHIFIVFVCNFLNFHILVNPCIQHNLKYCSYKVLKCSNIDRFLSIKSNSIRFYSFIFYVTNLGCSFVTREIVTFHETVRLGYTEARV